MSDLFDFSGEEAQREMGVAIPGNSILAVEIHMDKDANDKGLVRNKDGDKDMVSLELKVVSKPFEGATIFFNAIIGADNPEQGNNKKALNIGRAAIRGMIDSIAGLADDDMSEAAAKKRRVPHMRVLHGRKAVIKTKLEPSQDGTKEYARVSKFVVKGDDGYQEAMDGRSFEGDIMPNSAPKAAAAGGDDWGSDAPTPGKQDDWVGAGADNTSRDLDDAPDWA